MTYEEMLVSDKAFLLTEDVAELLGCKPTALTCRRSRIRRSWVFRSA